MRARLLVGLMALSGCASIGGVPVGDVAMLRADGPPGHMARVSPVTFRIVPATATRRATFELTGAWTNPPGAAAIDSLEVWGYGLPGADGSGRGQRQSFLGGQFPTAAVYTWPIDPIKSYAGSATVCVITWRNGRPGGTQLPLGDGTGTDPLPPNCAPLVPFEVAAEPTPLVTGVSASVRIIP